MIPPFAIRYGPEVAKLDADLDDIAEQIISDVPLWTVNSPTYIYDLASDKKASTSPIVFQTKYREIKNTYYNFERIYTDGSKDGKRVAAAAVPDGDIITFRLPDNASIFSAELKAIQLALDHIEIEHYFRYIIFTDSE